jgi:hypothetical protein
LVLIRLISSSVTRRTYRDQQRSASHNRVRVRSLLSGAGLRSLVCGDRKARACRRPQRSQRHDVIARCRLRAFRLKRECPLEESWPRQPPDGLWDPNVLPQGTVSTGLWPLHSGARRWTRPPVFRGSVAANATALQARVVAAPPRDGEMRPGILAARAGVRRC